MTSNPTIFDKAIAGSTDYDAALHRAVDADRTMNNRALAERLIVEDIQLAADVLRPVYDDTDRANGFVSLEVSPGSAHDTGATVAEARHLWKAAARPNVMIKVPATQKGVPAVEALTAEGINVNITLMFSLQHYESVAQAYLQGLARHPNPRRVTSVASIFVSRLDAVADRLLEAIGSPRRVGFAGTNCHRQRQAGIPTFPRDFRRRTVRDPQRTRRARSATAMGQHWNQEPWYRMSCHVEALIAPDTITTVPPATMDAFRNHGRVRVSLGTEMKKADAVVAKAAALGLDLHAITEQLQADGIKAFAASFNQLLATVAERRGEIVTAAR